MPEIQEARRDLSFAEAIDESLLLNMKENPEIFLMGIGLTESPLIFSTLARAAAAFPDRVINTPISEDALTGFALGASLGGKIPVTIHMRMDFMLLCMNQLVNVIAPYSYATGKKTPMVFRAIVGRGWGQGYQHSKSLVSTFAHIPGLTVVAPTTPSDAKGMLTMALKSGKPTIFLEHRWLYFAKDQVPESNYSTNFAAKMIRNGSDCAIITSGWMVVEALKAAEIMFSRKNISIAVFDMCNLSSPDLVALKKMAQLTPHAIVVDNDWGFCGIGAEISDKLGGVERIAWPNTHVPTSRTEENKFYPNALTIIRAIERKLGLWPMDCTNEDFYSWENKFKGPF